MTAMPRRIALAACAAAATTAHPALADRLLGISIVEGVVFKLDTADGELIKFAGHPISHLGGLDIDSAGNLYYLANNILRRLDLDQPSNDEFIGLVPDVFFESFEIATDVGYSGDVFSGIFYAIDLKSAAVTALGQYGSGGVDRITGLAATDYPGAIGPIHTYGVRVFLDDIIEVDLASGENLGPILADPLLGTTNLALGPAGMWFISDATLYRIDLTLSGAITPVLENLDLAGVDGLTAVHPEPSIATRSLPDGVAGVPYGPVALEVSGGGPGIQWVALAGGYAEVDLGLNQFALVGVPQGMQGQDLTMPYALPFAFPFYGETYTTVHVCNNGFLDLAGPATDPANSDAALIAAKRVCPLWDDLRTNQGNRDVHIDASVPGQVTFRWDALQVANNGITNFSCTLEESGAIQFNYGVPNANMTPTVGISNGDGSNFIISRYSGMSNLGSADSLRFEPQAGLPPGLSLSAGGVLKGVPSRAGTFTALLRLTDALGGFDEREIPIEIRASAPCPADVTGPVEGEPDGVVNVLDMVAVIVQWGTAGFADISGPGGEPDGVVDVVDLVAVVTTWGDCS